MQHAEHRVILAENSANGSGGMDAKRLEFAQQEESEDMVEIGIGERDSGNGRVAPLSRMQFRRSLDLGEQVRRCAQQEPREAAIGEHKLSLGARLAVERAGSYGATVCAGAVPLRKRASGR